MVTERCFFLGLKKAATHIPIDDHQCRRCGLEERLHVSILSRWAHGHKLEVSLFRDGKPREVLPDLAPFATCNGRGSGRRALSFALDRR